MTPAPKALQSVNRLNRQISKQRAEKPKAGKYGEPGSPVSKAGMTHNHHANQRENHENQQKNIGHPRAATQPYTAPVLGDPPEGAVPEALRQVQEHAQAQADPGAQK